jgi:uncharacterized protein YbaR (Trm112 family)
VNAYIFVMSSTTPSHAIDPDLLEMLRCPLTHSPLRAEGDFLIAEVGGLAYPVRDGIPVMLIEEAKLPAGVESLEALKEKLGGK